MISSHPAITLTTDFGMKDAFAGLMKGVIVNINPDARVIDLTHNISPHNIMEASRVIAMSSGYFPAATIHIAVVDPGVGGPRRPILVSAQGQFFIGPDNGIFTPVFQSSENSALRVLHITSSNYFLPMRGSTFHGRDVFAPVAAWLSRGVEFTTLGSDIDDYEKLHIPQPVRIDKETVKGQIISIDTFGNAISNITAEDIFGPDFPEKARTEGKHIAVHFRTETLPLVEYYEQQRSSAPAAVINSFGELELFVFRGNAAVQFDIRIGEGVMITSARKS